VLRAPERVVHRARRHRAVGARHPSSQQTAVTVDLRAQGLHPAAVRLGGEQVLLVQGLGLEVAYLQAQGLPLSQQEVMVTGQHLDQVAAERRGAERPVVGLAPQARQRVAAGKIVAAAKAVDRDGHAGLGDLLGKVLKPLRVPQLAGLRGVVDTGQLAGATVHQAGTDNFVLD